MFTKSVIVFLVLLSLVSVSFADEIQLSKENYSSFETLQAVIEVNLTPLQALSPSNVVLVRPDGSILEVPRYLGAEDKRYYFSVALPSLPEGEYTLALRNARYKEGNLIKNIELESTFNISNREENLVQVFPGFILKSIKSYETPVLSFEMMNKGKNSVQVSFSSSSSFLNRELPRKTLSPGGKETVSFRIIPSEEEVYRGDFLIHYNENFTYSIPVVLIKEASPPVEENKTVVLPQEDAGSLAFDIIESSLERELAFNESLEGQIPFQNTGEVDLHDLQFSFEGQISSVSRIDTPSLDLLRPGETKSISIVLNPDKNLDTDYGGELVIRSREGAEARLALSLLLTEIEPIINVTRTENQTSFNGRAGGEENSSFLAWFVIVGFLVILVGVIIIMYRRSRLKREAFENYVEKIKKR